MRRMPHCLMLGFQWAEKTETLGFGKSFPEAEKLADSVEVMEGMEEG